MSQTNTKQCLGARSGEPIHGGSHCTYSGDRNGNRGNSRFANSSFVEKLTSNCISHLLITNNGPRSNQLKKVLKAIPYLCQHKHYDYISDIVSTNTEPTQEYFLSNHPIKRRHSFKHHVKLGVVDPIIGLDVPFGNSPTNSEVVENTPISNLYPRVQHRLNYNLELTTKSYEWDKLISKKKSVMERILDRCDEDTRAEIALDSSYEDNLKGGELLKFLTRVHKVCTDTEDKDVFFGSSITRITKHHFRPATSVEQLLAAHPDDDINWDNTDPCDVSLDNASGTEDPANVDVTKKLVATTTTPMSTEDDKTWYNANEENDSWHEVLETMHNFQEWNDPPFILKDTSKNKSTEEHIEPDFMPVNVIQDVQSQLFHCLAKDTTFFITCSTSSFILCYFVHSRPVLSQVRPSYMYLKHCSR